MSIYSNPTPSNDDERRGALAFFGGTGPAGTILRFVLLAAAIIAVTLIANRCDDDDDGSGDEPSAATPTESAAPTPQPTIAPAETAEPTQTPAPTSRPTAAPTQTPEATPGPTAAPAATPAADVTVSVQGAAVALTGQVPDDDFRATIVTAVAEVVGADNVTDELTISADTTIDEATTTVVGSTEESTAAALITALASALGSGAGLDDTGLEIVASVDVVADLNSLFAINPVRFDTGSAAIAAESQLILDQVVAALADAPGLSLLIEGHTDSAGDDALNLALSSERAEAVAQYLIDGGIAPERLETVGLGETRPIADNDTRRGRARNRRIEFVIPEN